MVYAVVNCGFYEGQQARVALEMMENWCVKAGCQWGQGIGVGAGPMIPSLANVPQGKGPMKKLGKALDQLASNVSISASGETTYLTASFP